MSSYLHKKWNWNVHIVNDSTNVTDLDTFVWENGASSYSTYTSDSSGEFSTTMTETNITITGTDTISTDNKTPHKLSVYKYGLSPKTLDINFTASRVDTFYMNNNSYISENNQSTVSGYTGISIDHTNTKVTLTANHTVAELYDYCMEDLDSTRIKSYTDGIFTTTNGDDYILVYDLIIDNCTLSGSGKFIDMHTKTLTLSNGGSTNAKIQDINGVLVSFTLTGLVTNSEVRIYKESDMSALDGVEDSGGSFTYNYNYTSDVDVVVVVYGVGYNPIRMSLTLGNSDNSIPIQQQVDRWYKNP